MRKLKTKGIDALPDELGFWTYYRDGVKLTPEEVQQLSFDEICEATKPRTPEERREYYHERQAEYDLEEYYMNND